MIVGVTDGSLAGHLLVASPVLGDPNFARTVVLVIEHGPEGTVGVVLNRPTDLEVEDPLPGWSAAAAPPAVVFVGGPVATGAALCLARVRESETPGWRPVVEGVGTVDLSEGPDDALAGVDGFRVFSGCAGWAPGQLEAEIGQGAWFVVEGHPHDVLSTQPARLWTTVLRRQGARLAFFAHFPLDPSLN